MNIGCAIKEAMKEKGIKAAQLCRETGIAESYISMLKSSKIDDPQLSKVYAIATALGMTIDDLVKRALEYD